MVPTLPVGAIALERRIPSNRLLIGDVISFDLLGEAEVHRIVGAFLSRGRRHFFCVADAGGPLLIVREDQIFGRIEVVWKNGISYRVSNRDLSSSRYIARLVQNFFFLVYAVLHFALSRSRRHRRDGLEGLRSLFIWIWRSLLRRGHRVSYWGIFQKLTTETAETTKDSLMQPD